MSIIVCTMFTLIILFTAMLDHVDSSLITTSLPRHCSPIIAPFTSHSQSFISAKFVSCKLFICPRKYVYTSSSTLPIKSQMFVTVPHNITRFKQLISEVIRQKCLVTVSCMLCIGVAPIIAHLLRILRSFTFIYVSKVCELLIVDMHEGRRIHH